jgi:hypothetical protein
MRLRVKLGLERIVSKTIQEIALDTFSRCDSREISHNIITQHLPVLIPLFRTFAKKVYEGGTQPLPHFCRRDLCPSSIVKHPNRGRSSFVDTDILADICLVYQGSNVGFRERPVGD